MPSRLPVMSPSRVPSEVVEASARTAAQATQGRGPPTYSLRLAKRRPRKCRAGHRDQVPQPPAVLRIEPYSQRLTCRLYFVSGVAGKTRTVGIEDSVDIEQHQQLILHGPVPSLAVLLLGSAAFAGFRR